MEIVICQYCSKPAAFVDSSVVYGKSYGMIYYCESCSAWVGVHKGTSQPLGVLANAELRAWKISAHLHFDQIWKSRVMSRKDAYAWLAKNLGKTVEETHIGMFDVQDCKRVVTIVRKYWIAQNR